MRHITLTASIAMLLWGTASQSAMAATITDGFEGTSISPLWTPFGPGTEVLTNTTAHTGDQSVEVTASPTFPWVGDLSLDFGSAQYGTVSIWAQTGLLCCGSSAVFQIDGDLPAGQDTLAAIYRQSDGTFVADFGPGGEMFSAPFNSPNPGGWDQLEIVASATGVALIFDGATVFTDAALTSGFQYADFGVFGGPGGSEFFDDFSATTSNVVPEPSTPLLLAGGLAAILVWRRGRSR